MRSVMMAALAGCISFFSTSQGFANPVCPASEIDVGPVVILSRTSALTLLDSRYLVLEHGRRKETFDLERAASPLQPGEASLPANARTRKSFRASPQSFSLPSGRTVRISQLHGAVSVLHVGPTNKQGYAELVSELEQGRACGRAFSELDDAAIARLRPLAHFHLWHLLASGALDTLDAWKSRVGLLKTFTTKDERQFFFEMYGYRSADRASQIPSLARTDPYRVWVFAVRMVYLLLDGSGDDRLLTDLAIDQDGHRVDLRIFAAAPLPEGDLVKPFGFWTKLVKSSTVPNAKPEKHSISWLVDGVPFRGNVDMQSISPSRMAWQGFLEKFRKGLIVIDSNFEKDEVVEVVADYASRLTEAGFALGEPKASAQLVVKMDEVFADGAPDWLFRDGHAEFAPDFVFSLAKKGFLQEAVRHLAGQEQKIILFYPDPNEMTDDPALNDERVTPALFQDWMARRPETAGPLVFVDNACWGVYKARNLFGLDKKALIYVGAKRTVNFINAADVTAGSILLSAVLNGEKLPSVRQKLRRLDGRVYGEDWFMFPDDPGHPYRSWLVHAARQIERGHANGNWMAYIPE